MDSFTRAYSGSGPFEEVWFLEAAQDDHRGFWLRYTITDGKDPHLAVWGMVMSEDGTVTGHREVLPIGALTQDAPFSAGDAELTPARARGKAGPVSWDLTLSDGGRAHQHVPKLLQKVGRTYTPAIMDLTCSGTIQVEGKPPVRVEGARGVVGHIHGKRNRVRTWAWAHCNDFEGAPAAVFEGLSARLGLGPVTAPAMTSLALHLDGHHYSFSRTRELVRNASHYGDGHWCFEARNGKVHLYGEAAFAESPVARVRYTFPDGRHLYCSNVRFGTLRLCVEDSERGVDRELKSKRCAFEIGQETPDGGPVLIEG